MTTHGGRRPGAGRKKGSKNKATIAQEQIIKVIEFTTPEEIAEEKNRLSGSFLHALEEIAHDPSATKHERISAAKVGLSYLAPSKLAPNSEGRISSEELIERLHEGRRRAREMQLEMEAEKQRSGGARKRGDADDAEDAEWKDV